MSVKFPLIENDENFSSHFQSAFWLDAARELCRRHRISFSRLERAGGTDHIVFFIDDSLILKIYRPFRDSFGREIKALEFVAGKIDFKTPEIAATGEIEGFGYVFMTQMPGEALTRADWLSLCEKEQTAFIARLAAGLRQIHDLNAVSFEDNWAEFVADRAQSFVERQIRHGVNRKIIDALPAFIDENLRLVPTSEPTVFMHADVHFGNLRITQAGGGWAISGLFDFGDSRRGFCEYEFLAVCVLMIQGQGRLQREFFKAYGYADSEIDEGMRRRLMMLTMLYETSDLRRYAVRLKPEAVEYSLEELERAIWSFAE